MDPFTEFMMPRLEKIAEAGVDVNDPEDQRLAQFLASKYIEQARNPQPALQSVQQAVPLPNAGGAVPTAPASQNIPRVDPTTGITVKPTLAMNERTRRVMERRVAKDSSMAGGPPPPAFHGAEAAAPYAGDDIVQAPRPGQPHQPPPESGGLEELAAQGYNIAGSYRPSVPPPTPEERAAQMARHGVHQTADPTGQVPPPPPSGMPEPPPPVG